MSIVKFADVAHRANTKEDRFNTDKIYYVGGEHIESGELFVHGKGVIKGSTIGPMFYCGFTAGQILFVTRNPHLKKCGIVDFDGICSEKTLVIETKDRGVLLQEYLALIMQSNDFWDYCEENKSGGVNYFLNWSTLADYEFDLPPLAEQKVLAEKLWAAYRLKESYKKLLAATEEMVKSQFIEMIKDKQPNGKIGDLVDTNIKSVKKTHDVDDAIEYIDISSIDSVSRSISETTNYVVKSAPSRAQQCVEYGDILVSTVRPINRNIAVVTKESPNLVASTGFCVLRPKEEEYREYLLSVVLTDKYTQKMCDKASGGLYPAINNGDVLSYEVFIPDKEMLTKISTIYHQADKSEYYCHKVLEAAA